LFSTKKLLALGSGSPAPSISTTWQITISLWNDNDVVIYALEKIIPFARDNLYIFLAQNIWQISSIIGLQQELVNYMDNLKEQYNNPLQEDRRRASAALSFDLPHSESSQ
jgi:hypothetical protein